LISQFKIYQEMYFLSWWYKIVMALLKRHATHKLLLILSGSLERVKRRLVTNWITS